MSVTPSEFTRNVTVETAFNVLARARQLAAGGKEVIELEIGDSPFPTTPAAKQGGLRAIGDDQSHYCPSAGLPEFRRAASPPLCGQITVSPPGQARWGLLL